MNFDLFTGEENNTSLLSEVTKAPSHLQLSEGEPTPPDPLRIANYQQQDRNIGLQRNSVIQSNSVYLKLL